MPFASSRRGMLAARGRAMTLRRTGQADLTVVGFATAYRPEQVAGAVRQGDQRVAITAIEIAAASWPGPPRPGDFLVVDGKTWAIEGAEPKHEGLVCAGFDLWIRGGQ